jgi:hypothetical protein
MTIVSSYQPVNWSNMNNFQDFINNANQSAGNYLFMGIDLLVFFTMFISLAIIYGWEVAILSAGFVGIILSLLFVYMGVLNYMFAGIFVGLLVVMMMYTAWSNRNS